MAGMERFTQRARSVLSFAHQETERARNNFIGTEHLLIGLMLEGGVAGRVLRELGLSADRLRQTIEKITTVSDNFDPARVELGSQTQKALELAVDEARRLGHHYIGTEHILLGLVLVDDVATEVLRRLGVTAEQIRRQTRRVLNERASPRRIQTSETSAYKDLNQVLLIHGRNMDAADAVASYIVRLGLEVVRSNRPKDRQFDIFATEVIFAVVLLTADDLVVTKSESDVTKFHASPHVIYELGFFRGKLGYKHVCALFESNPDLSIELPTESFRVVYIPLDSIGNWKVSLAKQMQDAGIRINS
ncbi:MAG TPA: Clp protease N-terminal domain-containing protein, partial [Anaerolineales bacterium]|nr:Clp protease N-terminal domain-containing protein [Anaerolineales bacterium]